MAKVYTNLESLSPLLSGSVLTLGNFDGVNRAHQHLLAQAGIFAADREQPLVVVTFDPHPLSLLAPARSPKLLTDMGERARLLGASGADIIVILNVTPQLLAMEADAFARQVLYEKFRPSYIVEGPNFGFGRGRKGSNETLRTLGTELGFEVCVVEPLTLVMGNGERVAVSSTLCRDLLSHGTVRQANFCLGRPFALLGQVVEGARRGKSLGFPTANLQIDDRMLIPAEGVYAGRARVVESSGNAESGVRNAEWKIRDTYLTAISIGRSETFDGSSIAVEAHLLDFEGDLYGRRLRIEFVSRLRGQMKFDSPTALVEQIRRDVADVRNSTP